MADAAPPIQARGLARAFAGVPVVAGVDLIVGAGEVVVLLGPNGAGKTTLLRMLALLVRPTEGELAIFGTSNRLAPPEIRRRIGYAAHESLCYPDLTAAENLAFYARLGFREVWRGGEEPVVILEHPAGLEINLIVNAAGDGPNVLMDVPRKESGYTHVAWAVASLDEAVAALDDAGIALSGGSPVR